MENMYELTPVYDSRKSFYKKAFVQIDGDVKKLYSYESLVCQIEGDEVTMFNGCMYDSYTTRRHKREFLKQNGFNDKEYM